MYYVKGTQTAAIRVSDWEEVRSIGKSLRRCLFRGQRKAEWSLKSSIERNFESRGIPLTQTGPIELMILSDFQAAAHLFYEKPPVDEDTIAWLTLLRHYTGPTRLLDFTKSFYVAAYFALDGATDDCAIWSYNRIDLMKGIFDLIEDLCKQLNIDRSLSEQQKLNEIVMNAIHGKINSNLVLPMSGSPRNERQFLQQGLSLIPLNLENGLMGSLLGSLTPPGKMPDENKMQKVKLEEHPSLLQDVKLVKIIMTKDCFLDARLDLEQMNINGATLFRGLDGLGRHASDVLNSVERYLEELLSQKNG